MPENADDLRARAAELFRQGLLVGQAVSSAEGLQAAARHWNDAIELYRRAGSPEQAAKVEALLGRLSARMLKLPARLRFKDAGETGETGERRYFWTRRFVPRNFKAWHSFFTIGCFGFGGPMAVWGILHDEMVTRRKVLSNRDFLEAAVIGDIVPGPVTMDIVTYIGHKLGRWWGAFFATLLFILPSFLLMLFIAIHYDQYIGVPWVRGVFHALGAAVTAIVVSVGLELGREQVKTYLEVGILIWAFISSLVFRFDMLWVVLLAGLAGLIMEGAYPAAKT
jgi:chromate transporter